MAKKRFTQAQVTRLTTVRGIITAADLRAKFGIPDNAILSVEVSATETMYFENGGSVINVEWEEKKVEP